MTPFLLYIIVGGLIGWVASVVMHTNGQQGIVLNIVVGISSLWRGSRSGRKPLSPSRSTMLRALRPFWKRSKAARPLAEMINPKTLLSRRALAG